MIDLTHPVWFNTFRRMEKTKYSKAPVHVRRLKGRP
jgi:hypothetical protein